MLSHAENKAPLIGGRPLASSDKFRLMPALEPQRVNFSKSVELFATPQTQKLREVQRIARMALPSRAIRTLSFTLRLVCRENAHGPTLTKSLAARRRLAGCQEIGTPPHFVKKTNEGFSATPAAQRQRRTPLRTWFQPGSQWRDALRPKDPLALLLPVHCTNLTLCTWKRIANRLRGSRISLPISHRKVRSL